MFNIQNSKLEKGRGLSIYDSLFDYMLELLKLIEYLLSISNNFVLTKYISKYEKFLLQRLKCQSL